MLLADMEIVATASRSLTDATTSLSTIQSVIIGPERSIIGGALSLNIDGYGIITLPVNPKFGEFLPAKLVEAYTATQNALITDLAPYGITID